MIDVTFPYYIDQICDVENFESKIKKNKGRIENQDELKEYIRLKKHFDDICDCLDFINFGITATTIGMEIITMDSLIPAADIERYLKALIPSEHEKMYLKSIYSHRFHCNHYCCDLDDQRQLFERRLKNLRELGIINTAENCEELSFQDVCETVYEIFAVMNMLGVDRMDVAESTAKIATKRLNWGQTIRIYDHPDHS